METVIRIAIIYFFIMIGLRAMGKRDFSQLSPFDLVTLLLIPEIVAQAMIGEDFSITNAFIGLCTLFTLVYLTSVFTHKHKKIGDVIEGTPTVLVSQGKFVPENMNLERITPDEVFGEMHKVGLTRLEQVQWGILESDGEISLVPFEPEDKQVAPRKEVVG